MKIPVGLTRAFLGFGLSRRMKCDRYPDAPGFVFIAGGIGVTPVMSMLRALADQGDQRPLWLFYANSDWDSVAFREELDELELRLALTIVHIVEEASADYQGLTGHLDEAILRRCLPESLPTDVRYFLCGPTPLTDAAEAALVTMGVAPSHVRTELFELA